MQKQSFNLLAIAVTALILGSIGFLLYNKFFKKIELENIHVPQAEIGRISPPETLPDFTFLNEQGEEVNISSFKGKVLIINFWATWCQPCVKELPQFDQMVEIFGEENMQIIPISIDSAVDMGKLRKFYGKYDINNLKLYKDKDLSAYEAVMSFGVPTTILVDRDFKAHLKVSGYLNWQNPEIMNLINSL